MSKKWYPIINKQRCTGCGNCKNQCTRKVFDNGHPPVVRPASCIEGCRICGNNCPTGAITYFGEFCDWMPPHGQLQDVKQDGFRCNGLCSEGKEI